MLARHEEILKGRPAVQQNYYRRGALALAYPFTPDRSAIPAPSSVSLRAEEALAMPPAKRVKEAAGRSAPLFRDGLSVADVNADGLLDVVAPMREPDQPVLLVWSQMTGGAFAAASGVGPQGRACSSAPMGDLDRDGDVDALVTCNTGNILMRNTGDGTLAPTPQSDMVWPSLAGLASTLVDVDHDGDLDVHVVEPLGQVAGKDGAPPSWQAMQWIWRNDGSGKFTQVAGMMGLGFVLDSHHFLWADVDGDNAVDLLASTPGRGLVLARNDRSERFTVTELGLAPWKSSIGPPAFLMTALDADSDGDLDVMLFADAGLTLLLNDSAPGAPKFVASAALPLGPDQMPGALVPADLDLDGHDELILFGAGAAQDGEAAGRASLLTFSIEGRAVVVPIRPVAADGLDAQVVIPADIDGDGDVDLISRRRGAGPVILRNATPAGPAWINILPVGRDGRSNPHGLGAKLTMDAGTLRAHVERRSLGAPLCHSLAAQTFGLGARA